MVTVSPAYPASRTRKAARRSTKLLHSACPEKVAMIADVCVVVN